jgi:hypothetical protein
MGASNDQQDLAGGSTHSGSNSMIFFVGIFAEKSGKLNVDFLKYLKRSEKLNLKKKLEIIKNRMSTRWINFTVEAKKGCSSLAIKKSNFIRFPCFLSQVCKKFQ